MIGTRTADGKSTLMHHMISIWQEGEYQQGLKWMEMLKDAPVASKFSFPQANDQIEHKKACLKDISAFLKEHVPKEPVDRLKEVLGPFVEVALGQLESLQTLLKTCKNKLESLKLYLGLTQKEIKDCENDQLPDLLGALAEIRQVYERTLIELKKEKVNKAASTKRPSFGSTAVNQLWRDAKEEDGRLVDSAMECLRRITPS